jgi:cytochrome c
MRALGHSRLRKSRGKPRSANARRDNIGPDAENKVGPELNGLDGRKAGTVEEFNYSEAMTGSGITWREAAFKEYIRDPRAKVPGIKMVFAGIKSSKELDDLWAYVSQFDRIGNIRVK